MFSGTAFLTKEGKPAIIYHGQGSKRNQIAFALDKTLKCGFKTETQFWLRDFASDFRWIVEGGLSG